MRAFRRSGEVIVSEIEPVEAEMLTSFAEQLQELLGGEDTTADLTHLDAFDRLAASEEGQVELDHSDPRIERLFPPAYDADAHAAADFRRFTEDEARRTRIAEARAVLDDLARTRGGRERLVIAPDHVTPWLRTINAMRLTLSVRLEIVDEQSLDELATLNPDPRTAYVYAVYEWLGEILESLLEVL